MSRRHHLKRKVFKQWSFCALKVRPASAYMLSIDERERVSQVWKTLERNLPDPVKPRRRITQKKNQWTVWVGFRRLSSNLWIVSSSRRKLSSSPEPMISWRIWISSLRSSIDFRRRIGLFIIRPTIAVREQNAHHVETFQIWFLSRHFSDAWQPESSFFTI